jgi:hypothetical protein
MRRVRAKPTSRTLVALLALMALASAPPALAAVSDANPMTPPVDFPPVSDKTGLSVVISTEGGTAYELIADNGEELGDYRAPSGKFVQRCIRVQRPGWPTVYFRPDRGTDRVEVVFENFRLRGPAEHLPLYRVEIRRHGKTLGTADLPTQHWWGSRWRWQSSPRPILHQVPGLIRAKAVLPYKPLPLPPIPRDTIREQTYSPMGFAGLTPYMRMTGERNDIGPQTEAIAEYLMFQSAAARQTMFAQAEAAGTWQVHFRDEETGAPVSGDRYPRVNFYPIQSQTKGAPAVPLRHAKEAGEFEEAHEPNESYLPFLLTEDAYHLEELAFAVNYSLLLSPMRKGGALIPELQLRGWAWTLRSLFQLVRSAPENPPPWLLPKAYFAKRLHLTRDYMIANWLRSSAPFTVFSHSPPSVDRGGFAPWQDDMLTAMLGYGVYLGSTEWRPIFDWKLATAKARLNGTSGWPRTHAVPAQFWLSTEKLGDAAKPPITNWRDLALYQYDKHKQGYQPIIETADGKLVPSDKSARSYLYGVLTMARLLGDDSVRPLHDWYVPQLDALNRRWSYAADR